MTRFNVVLAAVLLIAVSGIAPPLPAWAVDMALYKRLLTMKSLPGNDHRRIVETSAAPWRAVGRLNNGALGGHCTATVIAPRLVLSAAHCLWNKRTGTYLPPHSVHFVAGWKGGDYLFHSRASALHPSPDFPAGAPPSLQSFANDWALIELERDPVPAVGMIPVRTLGNGAFQPRGTSDGPYVQAGYSADKRNLLSAHVGCAIWGIDPQWTLALHGCDALPGDSGSPLMMPLSETDIVLVGIHVGHGSTDGKGIGFAVPARRFAAAAARLR